MEFLHFDLVELIRTVGYAGLAFIVFAESGLLFGFFLPGDSLLFTAGFLASQDVFNIWILVPLVFVAAILGDSVGYATGYRLGPKIFKKEDSIFFHKNHLIRSQKFFEKHGGKTIILARFLPVVRTFAPILAGVGKMNYKSFLVYNITGAVLWAIGLSLLGYFLGSLIPGVDKYLVPIVLFIILASVSPTVIHVLRDQEMRADIITSLRKNVEMLKSKLKKKQ